MKKILFVLSSYDIGGTTISTLNLISVLDKDKYDISLWVHNPDGILKWMFSGIKTIRTCFIAHSLAIKSWRDECTWYRRYGAAFVRLIAKRSSILHRLFCRFAISKCCDTHEFDTVIACEEGNLSFFVSCFKCPNLVAWIRCDYYRYFQSHNNHIERFYYLYNHIVCVSERTKRTFLDVYPSLIDRTICIYNPQDSSLILSQSDLDDNDVRFKTEKTTIVSLGRLDIVKRFEEIPLVARTLLDKGLDFRWYIIGSGERETTIAENIKQFDVSSRVIMLGAKSNPHFYIKRADLYVCLSSSEACPRVINEAKILGTPVVSTDFPTIYEYLEDGVNGRIVPLERISEAIFEILTNKDQYKKIKMEIDGFSFDNRDLIKKVETIL